MPIAPEVPTIAQAGVLGYEASFGEVLLMPKGTPEATVKYLNETIGKILAQPEVRERMLASDLEFVPNTPDEAAARLKREAQKWSEVIKRLGCSWIDAGAPRIKLRTGSGEPPELPRPPGINLG